MAWCWSREYPYSRYRFAPLASLFFVDMIQVGVVLSRKLPWFGRVYGGSSESSVSSVHKQDRGDSELRHLFGLCVRAGDEERRE